MFDSRNNFIERRSARSQTVGSTFWGGRAFVSLFMTMAALSGLLVSSAAFAQANTVPQLINYQGRLTDQNGDPLPTGEYALSFSIYNAGLGGALVWGPQVFDGQVGEGNGALVPVVQGYFNVMLGPRDISNRTIGNAFDSDLRYLEITIGDGPPIAPRQQILSAPYALQAAGSVPVGGVIPYFGDLGDLSDNWVLCAGQAILDPDSPLNGTNAPLLVGRFPYGVNAGDTTGRLSGSTSHSHFISSSDMTSFFPRKSLSSWIGTYSPATNAGAFDQSLENIQGDSAQMQNSEISESHGHSEGRVFGRSNTATHLPPYTTTYYIIRIK